jgi:hypothetical protein
MPQAGVHNRSDRFFFCAPASATLPTNHRVCSQVRCLKRETCKHLLIESPWCVQATVTALATVEGHFSEGNAFGATLTHLLSTHLLSADTLDLKQLCIVEGKHCWHLSLSVYVLNDDGAVLDLCIAAASAALSSLQVLLVVAGSFYDCCIAIS